MRVSSKLLERALWGLLIGVLAALAALFALEQYGAFGILP